MSKSLEWLTCSIVLKLFTCRLQVDRRALSSECFVVWDMIFCVASVFECLRLDANHLTVEAGSFAAVLLSM